MNKIERNKQIEAVRRFFKGLPEGTEFSVCILLMKGMPEKQVRRRMHMNVDAWNELKGQIGEGLKKAGVRLRN